MISNDLIIRNDRNVVDVVVSLEDEVKLLRKEFEDFKQETRSEFKSVRQEMKDEFINVRGEMRDQYFSLQGEIKQLTGEVRGLNRTVDTMITVFTWGFALVAIAVAIAPMLREFFSVRFGDKHSLL